MNFNTIGIICEYNPFHFGHLYHINKTRELTKCKNLVCVMSGSVVQRGDVALLDKWTRTKAAVDAGADLVVELPAYYVLQSADVFAYGGIKLLNDMKIVDAVSFGSESGRIESLKKAGEFLSNPTEEYRAFLSDSLKSGNGYPASVEYALRKCLDIDDENFFSPNNILATEYIAAAKKLESAMEFVTVERRNNYHSSHSSDGYLSATAVRDLMKSGSAYEKYAPDYSASPRFVLENAEAYVLGFLRNVSPSELKKVKGHEEGMANLVINSAKKASCLEELFEMCVSRRYTRHRIRRFVMCAILGINCTLECDYLRVLGFNSAGAGLLKQLKEKSELTIITKTADYLGSRMFDIDVAATDFAYLCCDIREKRICGYDFVNGPYVHGKINWNGNA